MSDITIVDRWDAARDLCRRSDGQVRAVIHWVESSRKDALRLDDELRAGRSRGPLHGWLVGVKDNIDTRGTPTTAGARFLGDNVPEQDAHAIGLLREAGAIVVAKLNMAELAWGATTQNETYGACRNPWDLDRIPGGSSGGSGAALAARYCDVSLGTDTGASVRVPAALNGVVGLRPTFGAISNRGVYPVALTQDTVGPMGRDAAEVAHLTELLVDHDPLDAYSVQRTGPAATARLGSDVRGWRIGIPDTFFYDDLEPGVATRVQEFLDFLRAAGADLLPVADFGQADGFEHWTRIVQVEGASLHQQRIIERPEDFSEDVRGRIGGGLTVEAVDLARSLAWRTAYRHRLARVLDDLDVIVTPVVPVDVPMAGGYDSRAQTQALGRITYPWALHDGPTLSLPIGFHPTSGMPVGIALSARRWNESALFGVADYYQRRTDWHDRQPPALG
ncbi:amidase [Nocardioides marmotae]|uniref:amidase n=1 Tax=Nocardioides marmotae TaxID=2663857 RepID=UPI001CA8280D|nr:amidase [Nocardioides marmotae]